MFTSAHLLAYAGNGINRVFATITIKEGVLRNILLRRRAKEALRTNSLRWRLVTRLQPHQKRPRTHGGTRLMHVFISACMLTFLHVENFRNSQHVKMSTLTCKVFCMFRCFACWDVIMHVYTCQHMKVFNMQFYMIYMISRETSLYVLHIHVNCSNIAVIVVFIHVNICGHTLFWYFFSYVHTWTCMLPMLSCEIWNMHFYVTYMFEGATYTLHVPD